MQQCADDDDSHPEEREQRGEDARVRRDAQRCDRERRDPIDSEIPQSAEVEFRGAGGTRHARIRHRDTLVTDPTEQTLHEAVALAQLRQRTDGALGQQTEVAGVRRNWCVCETADDAVEGVGGGFFEPDFTVALNPRAEHIVVAFQPLGDERWNQRRRILPIRVEDDDTAARDLVETGGHRDFLAEIARQTQQRNGRIGRLDFL